MLNNRIINKTSIITNMIKKIFYEKFNYTMIELVVIEGKIS
jgi:hypothetical protein